MTSVYQRDHAWFADHPGHNVYQRGPFPGEWQAYCVPHDAVVTVHRITHRCTVRVLHLSTGQRIATALDSDANLDGADA